MRAHKRMVVSAVNLVEGGTLAVLLRFLQSARSTLSSEWQIIALVHKSSLVQIPGVETIAFPAVKGSWLRRIWFEYWQCLALSKTLNADLWLAMHDMTPRVKARRQAVYCHNPMPFYRMSVAEIRLAPRLLLFNLLYGTLYRINIRRSDAVIVQQEWLRCEFERRFGVRHVIVARPMSEGRHSGLRAQRHSGRIFFYPAFPRVFKNFELIGEAVRWLERQADWQGEVRITLLGNENAYATHVHALYSNLKTLKFVGLQSSEAMTAQYGEADCLLFPSRLETWGLPLTEAKAHGLAVLAADLPYARETVGTYDAAAFFDVADPIALGRLMLTFQRAELTFVPHSFEPPREPYAADWPSLVRMLTEGVSAVSRTGRD